jgi:hypothetical protein
MTFGANAFANSAMKRSRALAMSGPLRARR